MKILTFLSLMLLYGIAFSYPSMDSRASGDDQSHQFDFWIGSWDIQQKILNQNGGWVELKASTVVSPILDGKALEEHWEGEVQFFWKGMQKPEPLKGLSLRYYDTPTGKWNIYWMDTESLQLGQPFTGNFSDDKGEFFLETETEKGKHISRITFSNITENSIKWDLAISKDGGKTFTTIWIMNMKRQ